MSVPNPVALDILHIDMLHDMLHDMSPSSLVSLLVQLTKVSTIGDGQASSLHGKSMGKQWKQWQTLFWGARKSLQMVTAAMKLKEACYCCC